jgi:hypothetical protein
MSTAYRVYTMAPEFPSEPAGPRSISDRNGAPESKFPVCTRSHPQHGIIRVGKDHAHAPVEVVIPEPAHLLTAAGGRRRRSRRSGEAAARARRRCRMSGIPRVAR